MKDNVELIFFNPESPPGYRTEIIQCHPNSVRRIVQWYGAFCAGDDITLHMDGVEQELDLNNELVNKDVE